MSKYDGPQSLVLFSGAEMARRAESLYDDRIRQEVEQQKILLDTRLRLRSQVLWSGLLDYEIPTKIFHINFACFVGTINGRRFAPMVYEMPEL